MLNTKLIEFLPEEISDEAAYHLVNFIIDLALELKNHYVDQLDRYAEGGLQEFNF